MRRTPSILRFLLAAAMLLLSMPLPAAADRRNDASASRAKEGRIERAARSTDDGAILPARLQAPSFGTRHGNPPPVTLPGLPGMLSPLSPGLPAADPVCAVGRLRQWRTRSSGIIPAQLQGLYPKHWFW